MHHPWRILRSRPKVDVVWADLPYGIRARTDGAVRIWLDYDLLQVERRCAIDHELAHIDLGHRCGADEREELAASKLSARRLIAVHDLEAALRWSLDLAEVAEALWVTEEVLAVRLRHLHPAESALLRRATAHHREEADAITD